MLAIEPQAGPAPVVQVISHAQRSFDLNVYEMTSKAVERALRQVCQRGVRVRVMIETKPYRAHRLVNKEERALGGSCVHWKSAPARFERRYVFDHAKYVVADAGTAHASAELGTANFTWSAFHRNREYLWTTHRHAVTHSLATIFEADWHRKRAGNGPRQHLVVSPGAAPAVLRLVNQSGPVEIEAEELGSAHRVMHALEHKGRQVELILPKRLTHYERKRARALKQAGVQIRLISSPYMHAKMIVGEHRAFIGSQNFSHSSLYKNREVGVVLGAKADLARLHKQFEADWRKAHDEQK